MSNWTDTSFTRLLDIKYPIIQGPFGLGSSSVQLTAAISNAGGLGSFGANDLTPEDLFDTIINIQKQTDKPFAVNLWVSTFDDGGDVLDDASYAQLLKILLPYYSELGLTPPPKPNETIHNFDKQVQVLLDAKPPVFNFVFGIPSQQILHECRERNIMTIGGASTVEEAIALESAGVDMIVASGFEAGGHRTVFLRQSEESFMGTFALVPQIADKVSVPVIAAGGIADGRGVAAALILGADAAQIGTAFSACKEPEANPLHRDILFREEARNTILTCAFTGRLARGIFNRFAADMKEHEAEPALYPAQSWVSASIHAAAIAQRRTDLMRLWAGQSATLLRHYKVTELFSSLVHETEEIFNKRFLQETDT